MQPKPLAQHLRQGTFRKDRHQHLLDQVQPQVSVPSCPPHLSKEAKREWKRLTKELFSLGLLTKLDRAVLAAYCQAWSTWQQAEEHLRVEGPIQKTANNFDVPSPWIAIANRALANLHRFGKELCLSPSSRNNIKAAPPKANSSPGKILKYVNGGKKGPETEEEMKELLFGKS